MLTDAQVERYSRQVILPEVGGRGQERLLAARVALAGAGEAAAHAATLLGRAGVGALDLLDGALRLPELAPDCRLRRPPTGAPLPAADVVVDLAGDAGSSARLGAAGRPLVLGTRRAARATVATLVGRPCLACARGVPRGGDEVSGGPLAAPVSLLLGALAASEVLRVLLLPTSGSRLTTLDLGTGTFAAAALEPAGGCPRCGGSA